MIIDSMKWQSDFGGEFSSIPKLDPNSVYEIDTDKKTVTEYLRNKEGDFYVEPGKDVVAAKTTSFETMIIFSDEKEVLRIGFEDNGS